MSPTAQRYLCIHGHFYQPPRENPWLEAVETQDSAYPYHDWNERVTAECYAPNARSRVLDPQGRIVDIVNNYARISFNFGPTLLSWMEGARPDVYAAILEADRDSRERFSGHGSALAQVHSHVIMPLAHPRDRATQVRWGVADFRHRFGRDPEGMWLAETAADLETLEVLAEHGIRFTILAPNQARRVRRVGESAWEEVGQAVDPSRAYSCRLPSGRTIALFFYDGPISRAVAFEGLLSNGETFARRLLSGFDPQRQEAQLGHIATDGESYGHHHRHGEMALSYALQVLEEDPRVRLTNYGEFLERHPPEDEVEIQPQSSWSCAHGIERWRSDCGCHTGGGPGWHQRWRQPLRQALDWLREALAGPYQEAAGELFADPWAARDEYVAVVLDRSPEVRQTFLARHGAGGDRVDGTRAWELLEMQRHALLMYTSCGWFFNELSGIETVQILQYAARALQLGEKLFGERFEEPFVQRLARAESNLPQVGDGRAVWERMVLPAELDLPRVGAHYAVSSLFSDYPEKATIYCYDVRQKSARRLEAGEAKLAVGQVEIRSRITGERGDFTFGSVHLGGHLINGGVRVSGPPERREEIARELVEAFERADLTHIIRLLDRQFPGSVHNLASLFRDEQRKVLDQVLGETLARVEAEFRQIYERQAPLMRFLRELGTPLPRPLQAAAEHVLNLDLAAFLADPTTDRAEVERLLAEAEGWGLELDVAGLRFG
ncbi:MAG TPA: DUF3536 domain-containing protein, partial [Thermoanaerobaculia bacterium]|nr:DUF3536 domain-containing protein [Thermoanaerobaculia bacterium]